MPFLRFKNAHEPCGARIADYLERRGRWSGRRPAGHDYIGLFTDDEKRGWDRVMDATRSAAGNDLPWRGRDPVTYKHFVISPDPRDGVDLEILRSLTTEWAREFFGDGESPGKAGCYEVAIVYHDDNEARIPHAHVVVNSTDLLTGKRIQLGPSMIKGSDGGEMFTRLQEISAEHGLRYFGDGRGSEGRGRYFTKTERALARQGRYSWKDDLCNRIVVARRLSRDEPAFTEALSKLGVTATERSDGDYLFAMEENPRRWRATGKRLGRNYTRGFIRDSLSMPRPAPPEVQTAVRRNVMEWCVGETVREAAAVADAARGEAIADVALALKVQNDFGIGSLAGYDGVIRTFSADPSRAKEVEALRRAREVASQGNFFLGVPEIGTCRGGTRAARPRPTGSTCSEGTRQVQPVRGRAEEPRPGRSRG